MSSQRTLLVLVFGAVASFSALADASGTLRWRANGSVGLQPGSAMDFNVPCGSIAFPCDGGSISTPLLSSAKVPRSLSLQVARLDAGSSIKLSRPQGMTLNVIGKTAVAQDLGVYGRVGTFFGRSSSPAFTTVSYGEGSGVSYGMGVSWELSSRASASVGWDSYDFRTGSGDWRDVRATSLGLQWRY